MDGTYVKSGGRGLLAVKEMGGKPPQDALEAFYKIQEGCALTQLKRALVTLKGRIGVKGRLASLFFNLRKTNDGINTR